MFIPVGYWMDTYGRKSTAVPAFAVLSVWKCHHLQRCFEGWTILQLAVMFLPSAISFTTLSAMSVACGLGNGLSTGLNMVHLPIHGEFIYVMDSLNLLIRHLRSPGVCRCSGRTWPRPRRILASSWACGR